ncbi:MAG: hypothetical protein RLZZ361_1146 [Cyanobacteriota bacterium]|jgi:hypothetical protein
MLDNVNEKIKTIRKTSASTIRSTSSSNSDSEAVKSLKDRISSLKSSYHNAEAEILSNQQTVDSFGRINNSSSKPMPESFSTRADAQQFKEAMPGLVSAYAGLTHGPESLLNINKGIGMDRGIHINTLDPKAQYFSSPFLIMGAKDDTISFPSDKNHEGLTINIPGLNTDKFEDYIFGISVQNELNQARSLASADRYPDTSNSNPSKKYTLKHDFDNNMVRLDYKNAPDGNKNSLNNYSVIGKYDNAKNEIGPALKCHGSSVHINKSGTYTITSGKPDIVISGFGIDVTIIGSGASLTSCFGNSVKVLGGEFDEINAIQGSTMILDDVKAKKLDVVQGSTVSGTADINSIQIATGDATVDLEGNFKRLNMAGASNSVSLESNNQIDYVSLAGGGNIADLKTPMANFVDLFANNIVNLQGDSRLVWNCYGNFNQKGNTELAVMGGQSGTMNIDGKAKNIFSSGISNTVNFAEAENLYSSGALNSNKVNKITKIQAGGINNSTSVEGEVDEIETKGFNNLVKSESSVKKVKQSGEDNLVSLPKNPGESYIDTGVNNILQIRSIEAKIEENRDQLQNLDSQIKTAESQVQVLRQFEQVSTTKLLKRDSSDAQ